jgi:sodium-dependent dicarboxylate transporter 2/3/5
MLMIAYSCNIGGIATPVGTPPNLIAIGMLEEVLNRDISFVEWMSFGVPVAVACFVLLYAFVRWTFCPTSGALEGAAAVIRGERDELGRWRAGEKAALTAFLVAVTLWMLPGLVGLISGSASPVTKTLSGALPEGASAILAATLLFLIPIDWKSREFALDWREAARIDWGTILLFGGGLSLGGLAFSTGLAEAIGGAALGEAGSLGIAAMVLIAVFVANIMTEFMSNTAMANLLIPMFLALAAAGAGGSMLPALGATLGCSLAFCLPVATPPNAIVYGSGRVPLTAMIRSGVALDLGCGLLTWAGLLIFAR